MTPLYPTSTQAETRCSFPDDALQDIPCNFGEDCGGQEATEDGLKTVHLQIPSTAAVLAPFGILIINLVRLSLCSLRSSVFHLHLAFRVRRFQTIHEVHDF